jgi:ActR/RegA family two-component response regulator
MPAPGIGPALVSAVKSRCRVTVSEQAGVATCSPTLQSSQAYFNQAASAYFVVGLPMRYGRPLRMAKKLLVVDDDNVHRSIICRFGEKTGFRSIGVDSFYAAAQLLHDTKIDCVTLDLSLGDRSGSEVIGLLSMLKWNCPIIVISGTEPRVFDEAVSLAKTLELDVRAAMVKPIDMVKLRLALSEIGNQVDQPQELVSEP